jgi:circadian clock protein KaiC
MVEEFVADTVIVLRNPLAHERRRRTIEILKLRGGGHERGEHPFGIDARRGVIVIPLTALESTTSAPYHRVSTGVDGLDDMSSGGVPSDAITLVYGPPGAGKSLLGCHFARAGLDAGERVLHYSFEDSAERLLRHADAIGLPGLREAADEGRLNVVARYPERLGLEELLIEIRRTVDEWEPGRLVIDSLSVLDRVSSGASFREFVVGLITLVREHQIAALCIHEVTQFPASGAITNVSTLADCLIELRYRERDRTHQRTVRVIKLRGASHELDERDYDIGDRGITLAPRPNEGD